MVQGSVVQGRCGTGQMWCMRVWCSVVQADVVQASMVQRARGAVWCRSRVVLGMVHNVNWVIITRGPGYPAALAVNVGFTHIVNVQDYKIKDRGSVRI